MTRRSDAPGGGRERFISQLAAATGQTADQVRGQLIEAVQAGYLVETIDGWQAALPAAIAGPDWTGPIT